jgi:drug/metabolite transporter (DMT)-like permease
MLAFSTGPRRTGPSTAAILSAFEPVVLTVLATLTSGEFLTPVQFAGGLLVLATVARAVAVARRGRQTGRHS